MRFGLRSLLLVALLPAAMLGAILFAQAQTGFDRPGGDYTRFTLPTGDPALCAARCERDARCRAWTFSYPGTVMQGASCWLKSRVTPAVANPCCVSGVKGAGLVENRPGPVEQSIDRFGGDYRNIEVTPDPAGEACKQACDADNRCRAWTYVRPGYQGTAARCYLKDKVTRPRRKPCCVSGVVR